MTDSNDSNVVKMICNDVEVHRLLDLFEEGKIPQSLATEKRDNGLYVLYFPIRKKST